MRKLQPEISDPKSIGIIRDKQNKQNIRRDKQRNEPEFLTSRWTNLPKR